MPSNKTHVLYLSYDGMTDPLGQSQVLAYLEGLSEKEFRFTLVSFEKSERFTQGKSAIETRCKNSHIRWLPLPYTRKPAVLSTLYDLWQLHKIVSKIFVEDKFEIIHCRSYITALIGLQFKRKHHVRFVFDMRGFYADERVDGGLWSKSHPVYGMIYRFFKKKEIQFFSEADYIISLTEAGKKIIHSWKDIPQQPVPIQVIPCCADLDVFDAHSVSTETKNKLKQDLHIGPNDFILCYLGSIGTWYMPDEMLAFFQTLLAFKPEAKFLFVTNEPAEYILSKAKKQGVSEEKIRIVSSSHQMVPSYLSIADAGIFFIKPVFSKQASSPTKQGEIMGMGMMHVCNSGVGDVDEIVRQSNCGVVVNEFNKQDYTKAIIELLQKLENPHTNIREAAFKYYSLEKGVALYAEVYHNLLRK